MNTLQNIILPDSGLSLPESLYVRKERGEHQCFNTFFNLLNVEKLKSYCTISDLSLKVQGEGHFEILVLGSHDIHNVSRILERFEFHEEREGLRFYPLPWESCPYRFLYLEVLVHEGSKISSLAFVTNSPVVSDVRLGATIVHFNRKDWVLPALKRLKQGLLDDLEYKDKISLVVVDNSQNIMEEEANGVEIIKNKNLGGTGGFTRGLLHFKDLKFTHCLFMDDDASCEVESLKRAWALLAYSKVPKFAIAGSLLLDSDPSLIYEKGAIFNGTNKALSGGYDMTSTSDLALVEKEESLPNYGGWWFFAFKISDISYFPFPFFVRGDDLMFSLMNRFTIYTSHGIGCWGDDFASKATPLACYLDARSILLNNIVSCKKGLIQTLIYLSKHFILHLFLFNYATVRAIRSALRDSTLGTEFWEENLDTVKIREEIATYSQSEKMRPLSLNEYAYDEFPQVSHRAARGEKASMGMGVYLQALLLNGAFLPDFFMKKNYLLMPKGKYGGLKFAFRYHKMICYDAKTSTGYIAKLDRGSLLREVFLYLSLCLKVLLNRKTYRQELERAVELYANESFWRSLYDKNAQ